MHSVGRTAGGADAAIVMKFTFSSTALARARKTWDLFFSKVSTGFPPFCVLFSPSCHLYSGPAAAYGCSAKAERDRPSPLAKNHFSGKQLISKPVQRTDSRLPAVRDPIRTLDTCDRSCGAGAQTETP